MCFILGGNFLLLFALTGLDCLNEIVLFCRPRYYLDSIDSRDVLYRHYGCCEAARAQSSLPKIETRRACDRCKRFKARCSGGIPCERCQQASQPCTLSSTRHQSPQRNSTIQEPTTSDGPGQNESPSRSPTTSSTTVTYHTAADAKSPVPTELPPNNLSSFIRPSISTFESTQEDQSKDVFNNIVPNFDSLDWNFFYSTLQDMAAAPSNTTSLNPNPSHPSLPEPSLDFDPWVGGFPGMLQQLPVSPQSIIDETNLDWDFDGFSLAQLDPFESRRLEILEYIKNNGGTACQLGALGAKNAKVFFHAYFRRFHPHSPFLHLPTFDIKVIPSELYFAMLLVGALHCRQEEKDEVVNSLWNHAEAYVWAQATVSPLSCGRAPFAWAVIDSRNVHLGH